jgi:hypothetical protein
MSFMRLIEIGYTFKALLNDRAIFQILLIVIMLKLKLLLACFLIPFSVSSWAQQTPATPATPATPVKNNSPTKLPVNFTHIAGFTCTIYKSGFDLFKLSFVLSIYSTYQVEKSCDAKYFYNLTLASIDAQSNTFTKSLLTLRGGAHGYTMDVNLSPVTNTFFYIGKLRFSKVGEVRITLAEAFDKKVWKIANVVNNPYSNFDVQSQIHYIWNIGSLAHKLIAPNGDRYILYAFTNEVATNLTRETLIDLGSRLNLPEGWSYENSLLTKTITVNPTPLDQYLSTIIFDDFNNFYVKYSP